MVTERLGTIETLILEGPPPPTGSTRISTNQLHQHVSQSYCPPALSSPDDRLLRQGDGYAQHILVRSAPPHETLTFPNMIIRNKAFTRFVGLDDDLATDLLNLERSACRASQEAVTRRHLFLRRQKTVEALTKFYEEVYTWFPILNVAYQNVFLTVIDGSLPPSPETCLALIIAALGSLVDPHKDDGGHLTYSELAFGMLSTVLVEYSVVAAQCLFFIAVYYSCLCKPLQAYEYVSIASLRIQTLLTLHQNDAAETEALQRTYWAVLLLESELCIQFRLPSTGIWNLDETTPLPSNHEIWASSPESTSHLSEVSGVAGMVVQTPVYRDEQLLKNADAYFLAEIAMRRMLHRCTTAVRETKTGELVYAPVIATELGYQLEQWHDHLPSSLKFDTLHDTEQANTRPSVLFLRTQYYSCLLSIHWPGVYKVIQSSAWEYELHTACEKFCDAYIKYLMSCIPCLERCSVNSWPLYASMFVFTMAVAKTMKSPAVLASIPSRLPECLSLAADTLGAGASSSPSLARLHYILLEELRESQV
ncbi:hypothetical protein LTR10_016781 [Elasticomyces elasticus]|uniref:Xylanolytic transcriptional activator regulatory domain-containing protein n=1 Tax=Exophiala sideris TaxID=1016849 RepID=A0ABR0JMT0_9EURO|nr:hypothetical protein LTR10_016781 [Elasticomyces elasticus]KAK5037784.1 hypothetical protein LTS07_001251 [Exophiala sideris]KAK5043767.1 hypothetical protein LTR13_000121 [Exophiala sideris]KAK5067266.1 hypothetical protein LTR69_001253 [Exophiala sideris]KAK5182599.1 hypothetical protein LTR44_004990 [Eurotiomycetes sp. CCFEE 6388]